MIVGLGISTGFVLSLRATYWIVWWLFCRKNERRGTHLTIGFLILWGAIFTASSYFLTGVPMPRLHHLSHADMALLAVFLFGPAVLIACAVDEGIKMIPERLGWVCLWGTAVVIVLGQGSWWAWQSSHHPNDLTKVTVGLHIAEAEQGFKVECRRINPKGPC